MSGFSPSLMSGIMQANTALMAAQQHSNAISHMDSRKQILETEIKSGNGDIEGKKKELEEIAVQREKASALQFEAMNQASASIGNTSLDASKETDNKKVGVQDTDKTEGKQNEQGDKVSKKASDTASELRHENPAHNVAAVDYEQGMQIAEEGKTNVAISPDYLEKIADSANLRTDMQAKLTAMAGLTVKNGSEGVTSQTWAVDGNGSIRHYSTMAEGTDVAALRAHREAMDAQGRAAFGDAFKGAFVTINGQAPAAQTATASSSAANTGIMIDLSM